MYALFGDTDFTARLAPALMGTLIVPLPYLLREQIGRAGAFAAAVALAIGPTYLYFSRFAREDIYIACITLGLLAVTFRFLERPRPHQPALIGALLALSFATKESTFITVFVAGTLLPRRARRAGRPGPILGALARRGLEAVGVGARRLRGRVHAALHDVPHPSRRAVGRDPRRARLLARAAGTRARRAGVVLLPRRPVRGGVARAAARGGRRRGRRAPADAAARCS